MIEIKNQIQLTAKGADRLEIARWAMRFLPTEAVAQVYFVVYKGPSDR